MGLHEVGWCGWEEWCVIEWFAMEGVRQGCVVFMWVRGGFWYYIESVGVEKGLAVCCVIVGEYGFVT